MKHTPGPWVHHPEDNIITTHEGRLTLEWQARSNHALSGGMTTGERDSNASLIAAAPELLAIAKDVLGMLQNCSITSGVCCCGEDMDRHSHAMDCGHTPVDSGAYYAKALFEDVTAAIAKATGE